MSTTSVRIWLMVDLPDTEAASECPDCGFDSVLRFPLTALSERGVSSFGHYVTCTRCFEDGDQ